MPSYLDLAVLAIILVFALLSMLRGLSREVLAIASWAAAAAAAYYFYPLVVPYLTPYIHKEVIAQAAAAALVFFATLIVVSLFTVRLSDAILDSKIGALDRSLGFVFGVARGFLLAVVAFAIFNWLVSEKQQPEWVRTAKTRPVLTDTADKIVAMLPEDAAATIDAWIKSHATAAPASDEPADEIVGSARDDKTRGRPAGRATAEEGGIRRLRAGRRPTSRSSTPSSTKPCRGRVPRRRPWFPNSDALEAGAPEDELSSTPIDRTPDKRRGARRQSGWRPAARGMRRLRHFRPSRRGGDRGPRSARPPASRAGGGRHRRLRRRAVPLRTAPGAGRRSFLLRRDDRSAPRAKRDRPCPLFDDRRDGAAQRPAIVRRIRVRRSRRRPQRQSDERAHAEARTDPRRRDLPVDDRHRSRAAARRALAPDQNRRSLRRGAGRNRRRLRARRADQQEADRRAGSTRHPPAGPRRARGQPDPRLGDLCARHHRGEIRSRHRERGGRRHRR